MERGHSYCPRSLGSVPTTFSQWGAAESHGLAYYSLVELQTALHCHGWFPKCGSGTSGVPEGFPRGSMAGSQSVVWGPPGFPGDP